MAAPFGGQFLFDVPSGAPTVNLGLTDDGTTTPSPGTVPGALNIEVFTSVAGSTLPTLASGFTVGVIASDTVAGDASPKVVNGFLTGRQLRLFGGDYRVTDSVTGSSQQTPAQIIAGSGNQTLVGAAGDTLVGGSGNTQLLDGLKGNQQITMGTGSSFQLWGGPGDTIVGNSGATSTSGGLIITNSASVSLNPAGNYTIGGGNSTITGNGSSANIRGNFGGNDLIDLTGYTGNSNLILGSFDTLIGGAGGTISSELGANATIVLPTAGSGTIYVVQGATITGSHSAANIQIWGFTGARIDLTGATGNDTVIAGGSTPFYGNPSTVAGSGETIIAGDGNATLVGGSFDSLVGGNGVAQIVAAKGSMSIVVGAKGAETISSGGGDTITALAGSTTVAISAGKGDRIDLTGNTGAVGITGAASDTITAGGGNTGINAGAGGMTVTLGKGGTDTLTSSSLPGSGNTIVGSGSSANLVYNPGASGTSVSGGDLIDLSGSAGNATVNAFSNGATQFSAVNDTVLAGNGSDTVWGGGGDRIGVGSVIGGSTVAPGGTHLWDHSTTVPGASIGFGTNDTVASTTYDTTKGTATRNPTVAGTSSAAVTVTNFQTAADFIFYQNESATTTSQIVATSSATTVGGAASTMITLPDGTVMTLVGVAAVTPLLFKP